MGTSWAKQNVSLSLDLSLHGEESTGETGGSIGARETCFSVVVVGSGPVFCSCLYCYQSLFPELGGWGVYGFFCNVILYGICGFNVFSVSLPH